MKKLSEQAREFAKKWHAKDLRKNGEQYFWHLVRVAESLKGSSDEVVAIAYLHDVLEDHPESTEEFRETFPEWVLNTVQLLTKRAGMDYGLYLASIKKNNAAALVKVADMIDNISDDPSPTNKAKYRDGLIFLYAFK